MSHILIVEDEEHLARGLQFNLEAEGHLVEVTDNGEAALTKLLRDKIPFDALVLDVMLPGKDGFTVASELRAAKQYIPLLMLTARSRPEDILKGFESGADDYLPKPFNLDILIARIGSLLRRKSWTQAAPAGTNISVAGDVFRFDGKEVDFGRLELRAGNEVYQLTVMECDLLRYMVRNQGKPISRSSILENVWGLKEDTDTRAIDNFIVRLRRYIEAEPSKPKHLLTVRGVGYEFVAEPHD
ncbi:MAG TPA: response regulator transcription factor [Terriglobales bacterium]|nr:response regulator transcription factor [Terriglobales bacterium]